MRLLLELSGEHPTLPGAEALGALAALGGANEVGREESLLLVETEVAPERLAPRLGLAHRVDEHLASVPAEPGAILAAVEAASPRVGPSFRVRVHRVGPHSRDIAVQALEREAGARLAPGRHVDFGPGADELRVVLGQQAHLALLRATIDRTPFDARHVRHRPLFSPIALHPRFARALVNLAQVKPGDRVADPFAGTGGLLVEAGLLGAKALGADLDPAMADGARAFLREQDLEGDVLAGDVEDTLARLAPLDAIVSDPPYGRSSWTGKEAPRKLHQRALAAMSKALRPGGRAAVVLPDPAAAEPLPPGLSLEQAHVQRVHRSLDRHYLVLRRA